MKYLLDTQALLWSFGNIGKLPNKIQLIIKDSNNEIYASSVSIWEIAIKTSIGKLTLPFDFKNIVSEIEEMNYKLLQINTEHMINVSRLPFHHRDPFDRLIISQAIIENLPVISNDKYFSLYQINKVW